MFTELPPTQTPVCLYVCLCAFGTMDQITYFYFIFQICIRVLFYSSDILRACFFLFFCESSVGFGGDSG